MFQEKNWTLRCVWVPAHTGVNAPLTAVWIQTLLPTRSQDERVATSVEGDSWALAA